MSERSELTGTGVLVRLALRRDRVRLPLWVVSMAIFPPFLQAPAIDALYPTSAELVKAAHDFDANATFRMLYGPVPAATVGGVTTWRASFLLVMIGLATALTVIRHTRADEQSGRAELLYATSIGRRAPLAAALLVAIGASVVVGAAVAGGMTVMGYGAIGGLAFGLQVAAVGTLFAGVGAVAAQLAEGAAPARSIAVSVLAASYLVRAFADAKVDGSLGWLAWVSPIGWAHQLLPYGHERWWTLALSAALSAALVVGAVTISRRRDFGAGVLPPRPGPAHAGPRFASPLALAWRLHRGSVIGWAIGQATVGAVLGGAATGVDDLFEDSRQMREVFERLGGSHVLIDAFLAGVFGIVGLVAAAQSVQAALRLRVEEEDGRAEPVLVASVGRPRWVASHLVFVVLGPAVSVLTAGLAGALTFGLADHHLVDDTERVLRAAAVQLPAVWVVGAVTVALFGVLPRWTTAAWAALSACFLVGQVGAVLDLDQLVLDLSPFTHVPALAGDPVLIPLGLLLAVAIALVSTGMGAFARRDLG